MRLSHPTDPELPPHHLSVDGMSPAGPNLSHWPGNRTPTRWKRDLSTAICMAFTRAPEPERAEFLGGADRVLNDHYDTDGFGSLTAILRPELAEEREVELLSAALVGDFQQLGSRRGFAIDRTVLHLARPDSPVAAEFRGLTGGDLDHARYRWLVENAEQVLAMSPRFHGLWRDELQLVESEVDGVLRGTQDAAVTGDASLGFGRIETPGPLHRMTLNSVAGAWRVLHSYRQDGGWCHRYHDRTESWFDLVSFHPLPRIDLRPVAAALNELDPDVSGPDSPIRWDADGPDQPVPELYRGIPAPQEYGEITRELHPSRLTPDEVAEALRQAFIA